MDDRNLNPGKLVFRYMKDNDGLRRLYFISYLRPDFVDRSVAVSLDARNVIAAISITSNDLGYLEWKKGHGIVECRQWETEDQAQDHGYLSRRYTLRLTNGLAPPGYEWEFLIPDVMERMEDHELAARLVLVLRSTDTEMVLDPAVYG